MQDDKQMAMKTKTTELKMHPPNAKALYSTPLTGFSNTETLKTKILDKLLLI